MHIHAKAYNNNKKKSHKKNPTHLHTHSHTFTSNDSGALLRNHRVLHQTVSRPYASHHNLQLSNAGKEGAQKVADRLTLQNSS